MISRVPQSSALMRQILEKISKQSTSSVREVSRSKLILLLLEGHSNLHIERLGEYTREKCSRWRGKWAAYESSLFEIESQADRLMSNKLEKHIRECLSDRQRSGCPSKFTAEEFCQILGLSVESPSLSGRPITHWTLNELVDELKKRGIVSSISRSHLGAFLKGGGGKAP